jgi:hypothetical protein
MVLDVVYMVESVLSHCRLTGLSELDMPWCSFTLVSINTRPTVDHQRHVQLRQPDKLAVAEHRFNHEHHVQLWDTKILSTSLCYMVWIIWEATESELCSNNMNKEDCLRAGDGIFTFTL